MTPLQRTLSEGRLIHNAWRRIDADGRELLCLLAAMSPEVAQAEDADACPARIAPLWLAHLLPWMDDYGTDAARPAVWARVADLQARWAALWPEGWPAKVSRRADARVRRAAVLAARRYATEREHPAIDAVVALLDRRIAGDEPARAEWEAAEAAAAAATRAAAEAATRAAAEAAWAAARAARAAEASAAEAAAEAAAAAAPRAAARAAAADALTAEILNILEDEIERGEHRREEDK
jgi:hypothetical protein